MGYGGQTELSCVVLREGNWGWLWHSPPQSSRKIPSSSYPKSIQDCKIGVSKTSLEPRLGHVNLHQPQFPCLSVECINACSSMTRMAWRPGLAGLCPSLTWCSLGLLFVVPTRGPTLPKVGLTRWLSGLRSLLETFSLTEPFPKCYPHITFYLLINCGYSGENFFLNIFILWELHICIFLSLTPPCSLTPPRSIPTSLSSNSCPLKKIHIFKQIYI